MNEEFELGLAEEDYYTTLGGLIMYVTEDIPEEGKELDLEGYHVTVLEAMQNRIIKVKLTPREAEEEEE